MFRIAVRPLANVPRRTFVSSVLLTRTWENESISNLRREARNRGLTAKGNKANLILRIQEHDKTTAVVTMAQRGPPVSRSASTAPAAGSVAPGIPPDAQVDVAVPVALEYTNIHIPDLSQPATGPAVQIPYTPDFWSSHPEAKPVLEEPAMPKLLVVAGEETHIDGGPSSNLLDASTIPAAAETQPTSPASSQQGGFWQDVAEDIGLPPLRTLLGHLSNSFRGTA